MPSYVVLEFNEKTQELKYNRKTYQNDSYKKTKDGFKPVYYCADTRGAANLFDFFYMRYLDKGKLITYKKIRGLAWDLLLFSAEEQLIEQEKSNKIVAEQSLYF